MKKVIVLIILVIMILNPLTYYKAEGKNNSPEELKRIDILLQENEIYVHIEDKDYLKKIKEKLEHYEILTQEEQDYLRECYLNMIKNKLGEQKFDEYCKLIEKRNSVAEFTQPERFRLYELEKELREVK